MAAGHSPLEHVLDHPTIELPGVEIHLPNIAGFQITRFMVMQLVAAVAIAAIVIPLARHALATPVTRGRFRNAFEAMILYLRNELFRPAMGADEVGHGHHDHGHGHGAGHGDEPLSPHVDADAFVPFLWTLFFYILFCNLLGMIPGGASPTGNINVTGALALITLGTVLTAGFRASGPLAFWVKLVPGLDVPIWLKPILWPLMFVIEIAGLLIRHLVLSVRLFANMLAGHIVIAVILGFILQAGGIFVYLVTPASILGVVALSLLELLVAFLQAYIFTFLAAIFIGSSLHPH